MDSKSDLITLVFGIEHLSYNLKKYYEYLSEGIDRWRKSFGYDKQRTKESELYHLVREHVQQFAKHPKMLKKRANYKANVKKGNSLKLLLNKQFKLPKKE